MLRNNAWKLIWNLKLFTQHGKDPQFNDKNLWKQKKKLYHPTNIIDSFENFELLAEIIWSKKLLKALKALQQFLFSNLKAKLAENKQTN